MIVVVEGANLPGRRCGPSPEGPWYENIHVGLCTRGKPPEGALAVALRPWTLLGLVRGDAPAARWEMDIIVRDYADGVDFGGPFVLRAKDDRHIGLAWGQLLDDGTFEMFRGAKLRLDQVTPDNVRRANHPGMRPVARLGLTDERDWPRCASVRTPKIVWSAEPAC
jgi:hypothetical protein